MTDDERYVEFPIGLLPESAQILLKHVQQVTGCPMSVVFAHVMFLVSSIIQRTCYVKLHHQYGIVRPQLQFLELDAGAYEKEKLALREIVFWPLHRLRSTQKNRKLAQMSRLFRLESCKDRWLIKGRQGADLSFAVIDDKIGKTLSAADLRVLDDKKYLWGGRDSYVEQDTALRGQMSTGQVNASLRDDSLYRPGVEFAASGAFYLSATPAVLTQRVKKESDEGAAFFGRSIFVFPSSENVNVLIHPESPLGERYKAMFDRLFASFTIGGKIQHEIDEERWKALVSQAFDSYRNFARVLDNPRVSGYIGLQETNALKMAICLHAIEWVTEEAEVRRRREKPLWISEEHLGSALALQAWFVGGYLRAFVPEYAYFLEMNSLLEKLNKYLVKQFTEKLKNPEFVQYYESMQCYVFNIAKQEIRQSGPVKLRDTPLLDFMIAFMKDLGVVHVVKAYKGKRHCYFAMRLDTGLVLDNVGPIVAALCWRYFQPFGVGSEEAAMQKRISAPEFVGTGRFRQLPKP